MRSSAINKSEMYAKRAVQYEQQAERAKVRQERALKLGVQREVDGAERTIKDALENAQHLRDLIAKGKF